MFRKIIYVFLGFFATVFALNVETGFNDGIMNVTLYEVEGLAQGECGDLPAVGVVAVAGYLCH